MMVLLFRLRQAAINADRTGDHELAKLLTDAADKIDIQERQIDALVDAIPKQAS